MHCLFSRIVQVRAHYYTRSFLSPTLQLPRNPVHLSAESVVFTSISASRTMGGEQNIHSFSSSEVKLLRKDLLNWYDGNKRDLPWRRKASIEDGNERSYAVWVSEIMLQQTQVATVIEYYNKWMTKWPTLEALAKSSLEEVNEMWSGLGYYSRGRRLHEGAHKVVEELNGEMPRTAATLEKLLPGVGRYTAGAIASIAFGESTGLVDGNVVRVFSRLRAIGADSTAQNSTDTYWSLAHGTVDPDRAGDYNQALMELGATVCTPKSPSCHTCPLAHLCVANAQVQQHKKENASKLGSQKASKTDTKHPVQIVDIECAADACKLCLPKDEEWDSSLGVMNYPRKPKKKPPREEQTAVTVLYRHTPDSSTEYLLVQRPPTGLLANLWEFPSVTLAGDIADKQSPIEEYLQNNLGIQPATLGNKLEVGPVIHIFSHIHQTYNVQASRLKTPHDADQVVCERDTRWLPREELLQAALSTAMKKVFKAFEAKQNGSTKPSKGTKRKSVEVHDGKKQLGLAAFFKPRPK